MELHNASLPVSYRKPHVWAPPELCASHPTENLLSFSPAPISLFPSLPSPAHRLSSHSSARRRSSRSSATRRLVPVVPRPPLPPVGSSSARRRVDRGPGVAATPVWPARRGNAPASRGSPPVVSPAPGWRGTSRRRRALRRRAAREERLVPPTSEHLPVSRPGDLVLALASCSRWPAPASAPSSGQRAYLRPAPASAAGQLRPAPPRSLGPDCFLKFFLGVWV